MFDIGLQEMLVIGVLALLVFGPSKLPELGRMRQRSVPGVVKSTRRLAPSKLLPKDDRRAIEDVTVASSGEQPS